MRIAVCMSGNLRNFDKNFYKWENFIKQFNPDMFLHIWDFSGLKNSTDPGSKEYQQYDYEDLIPFTKNDLYNYGFKKVEIENFFPTAYNKFFEETKLLRIFKELSTDGYDPISWEPKNTEINFFSMWYKRWKCFDMMNVYSRQNNITYDLVIYCRPEISIMYEDETIWQEIPKNFLLLPANLQQNKDDNLYLWVTPLRDTAAIGSFELVREYCSFYPRLETFIRKHKINRIFHEEFLYKYLEELNIPLKYFTTYEKLNVENIFPGLDTW